MSKQKRSVSSKKSHADAAKNSRKPEIFRTPVKLGSVLIGTLMHTAEDEQVAFCYRTEHDGFALENDVKHFETLKAFGRWFKTETGVSLKRLREELVRTGHFY